MVTPLQKTKLFIPPARAKLVDRPRLIERLDGLRAANCRVALISAPAGSGKTTLVVQWLASLGEPAGWLSLDARDNLPARFFAYLVGALQAVVPGAGKDAFRETLNLLELPGASPEEVIPQLTNDLLEASGPFVLALDDFHTITNPLLHQAVDLLIEAQPPQMRLVLLSREDPAMQLARRRARGQLVELRQEDLRFTLEEALAFLNQSMDLGLSIEQVRTLDARTEGWIAGLQMAALSLQRAADTERFLQDFSGSHRFILDYLLEEVLAHQPAELHSFLMETSIVERMCAGLCASITGKSAADGQKLLEQLARGNLFVIPLDEEQRWYRYHHLFRDLLLARLQVDHPARANELHRRASDWYEANGEPRLAVEYALKAEQPQQAADLISRHITERWQTVDLDFHLLLQRLPFAVIAERPALCLQAAWLGVLFGQVDRILAFVEAAERSLNAPGRQPEPGDAGNRAFARTLHAYVTDLDNQPVDLDESLHVAFAAIPAENTGMRNSVAVVIGSICFMEGDFAGALRYFEDALERDKRVNGTNAVPIATMRMAGVLKAEGRLREVVRRLSQSEAYVRARGSRRFYISGAINLLWGDVLLEWNRLDEAEAQMREGMRLLEDWPIPQVRSLGWSLLARLHIARGELAEAGAALAQADALREQHRFHVTSLDAIERARVRLYLLAHNWPAVDAWARETEQQLSPVLRLPAHSLQQPADCLQQQADIRFRYEGRLIELCRAWLALGRDQAAVGLLTRLLSAAQQRNGSRVMILALLAAARGQEPAAALAYLDEALRLAAPEGYLRTFAELGAALHPLLKVWLQQQGPAVEPQLRDYAQQVLAACGGGSSRPVAPAYPSPGLPEALSQREQEVLLLMAKGLTNQQIAVRLVISVRTVKKHVENIHGKLGVQNRTQAVARARELKILE